MPLFTFQVFFQPHAESLLVVVDPLELIAGFVQCCHCFKHIFGIHTPDGPSLDSSDVLTLIDIFSGKSLHHLFWKVFLMHIGILLWIEVNRSPEGVFDYALWFVQVWSDSQTD